MKRKSLVTLATASLAFALALPTGAATVTDNFTVSATVNATCTITANDLVFGAYDISSGTDHVVNTTLDLDCTAALPYAVALSVGSYSTTFDCTNPVRRMFGATNGAYLNYTLGHSSVANWGCDTTNDVEGTGVVGADTLTVIGTIPFGQAVIGDSYSDDITATVTF